MGDMGGVYTARKKIHQKIGITKKIRLDRDLAGSRDHDSGGDS